MKLSLRTETACVTQRTFSREVLETTGKISTRANSTKTIELEEYVRPESISGKLYTPYQCCLVAQGFQCKQVLSVSGKRDGEGMIIFLISGVQSRAECKIFV